MRNNYYHLYDFYQAERSSHFLLVSTEKFFYVIIFDIESQLLLCWKLPLNFVYLKAKIYLKLWNFSYDSWTCTFNLYTT